MAKSVLIAPADGPLGAELVDRGLRIGWTILAGYADSSNELPEPEGEAAFKTMAWNAASFISARSLVLEALCTDGTLDAAYLITEGSCGASEFGRTGPAEIECTIDRSIKGLALLSRELLATYERQRSGRLSIVTFAPEREPIVPLDEVRIAAASALGASLTTTDMRGGIVIDSFESRRPDVGEYAEYIIETSRDLSGVGGGVHRYGANLLSRIGRRGR